MMDLLQGIYKQACFQHFGTSSLKNKIAINLESSQIFSLLVPNHRKLVTGSDLPSIAISFSP